MGFNLYDFKVIKFENGRFILFKFSSLAKKDRKRAYEKLLNFIFKQKITLKYDELGKPFLSNSNIYISISHTADLVIMVLSKFRKIGIDIQMDNPTLNITSFQSDKEIKFIKETGLTSFISIKEALGKYLGIGLLASSQLYELRNVKNINISENITGYRYYFSHFLFLQGVAIKVKKHIIISCVLSNYETKIEGLSFLEKLNEAVNYAFE